MFLLEYLRVDNDLEERTEKEYIQIKESQWTLKKKKKKSQK